MTEIQKIFTDPVARNKRRNERKKLARRLSVNRKKKNYRLQAIARMRDLGMDKYLIESNLPKV